MGITLKLFSQVARTFEEGPVLEGCHEEFTPDPGEGDDSVIL